MSRIVITPRHLQTISRHAAASYPEECCGFLIGHVGRIGDSGDSGGSGDETTVVARVLSVGNERTDSRHNRFLIHPETVLAAHKEARALGLDVMGYYHSHPDHPARPSEFDREHAWPGLSYVIVSVEQGKVAETRSWRLSEDRERFAEEIIEPAAGLPGSFPETHKEAVP
jgi:proteasome lid subunit RPN8/RPN11